MSDFRAWRRRLRFGLPTILGLDRRAFVIPYRYANTLPQARQRDRYGPVEALFDAQRARFSQCLGEIERFRPELLAIGDAPAPAPRWRQDWFPVLMARQRTRWCEHWRRRELSRSAPAIRRGFSRAVSDRALATAITAIDPAPRAALEGLENVRLVRRTLQAAGLDAFECLRPGDVLAIDSSHILMPGSDVDMLLNHVLPVLPDGVVVHIHDIFLPDDYPAEWAWRGYNEQLGVAPLLTSGGWQPLFASHFVATRMAADLADTVISRLELPDGAHESSLWLKKG